MKRYLLVLLLAMFGFASCTSGLRIEKRKHHNGFYIAGFPHHETHATDSADDVVSKDAPKETTVERSLSQTQQDVPDSTRQSEADSSATPQEKTKPLEKIVTTIEKRVPQHLKQKMMPPPYEGPVEAKKLNAMILVALGLLFLSVMLTTVALIGPFYWALGLIVVAPLFALAALVLSIRATAVTTQRRNYYAKSDPETSKFYSRQRTGALTVLALSIIICALFALLGLLLLVVF